MRDRPVHAVGLLVGGAKGRRLFVRSTDAYYQVAKKLVHAKYPMSQLMYDGGEGPSERFEALFCGESRPYQYEPDEPARARFDERLYSKFIRRVARFLAFVDSKRERFVELTDDDLHDEHERCERAAGLMMDRAYAASIEIKRRRLGATT